MRTKRELLIIFSPVVLFFLIFNYAPMVGLLIAFKNYVLTDGILNSPWVGFDNFVRLFGSGDFLKVLQNTLVISFLRLIFGFFSPIILAIMLNELRISLLKRSIQTLSYLPHFFSWVILGGIFIMLLSGNGPINSLVRSFGGSTIPFLSNSYWFIAVLVVTGIWQSVGWASIVYLAALSGINPDLYEAAEVDGASRWDKIRHITLPALVPTMIVLFILGAGSILNAGFDQIYNMYNPQVMDKADIIDTFILRQLMQNLDFSIGTAAGMFKAVVGIALIVTTNVIAKKISGGEQGVW